MAEAPEDNDLNFSDIDSDNEEGQVDDSGDEGERVGGGSTASNHELSNLPPIRPVIAHKQIRPSTPPQANDEFEAISDDEDEDNQTDQEPAAFKRPDTPTDTPYQSAPDTYKATPSDTYQPSYTPSDASEYQSDTGQTPYTPDTFQPSYTPSDTFTPDTFTPATPDTFTPDTFQPAYTPDAYQPPSSTYAASSVASDNNYQAPYGQQQQETYKPPASPAVSDISDDEDEPSAPADSAINAPPSSYSAINAPPSSYTNYSNSAADNSQVAPPPMPLSSSHPAAPLSVETERSHTPTTDEPGQIEDITPPNSPLPSAVTATPAQFDDISDDEDDDEQPKKDAPMAPLHAAVQRLQTAGDDDDAGPEGSFSPVVDSDHEDELNFHDEDSNDSGYHIVQKSQPQEAAKTDSISSLLPAVEPAELDVEAPIASPFSDLGDDDDGGTVEDNLISNIVKQDALAAEEAPEQTENAEAPEAAAEEEGEDAGDLIADIFGDSDEEEEEFEGFAEEELLPEKPAAPVAEDSDSEIEDEIVTQPAEDDKKDDSSDDDTEILQSRDFVSDFDLMLEKKKLQNRMKRRRKADSDAINDNDDIIAAMLKQMKEAAEEDRILNQCGKAATKKMRMLPSVVTHLRKHDLQSIFIDCGVLPAMKDWLTPLPDNSLPHINIREALLKVLLDFPPLDKGALKVSGVGRSVMLLYKHPKESRENKKMAQKIISDWARPIFSINANFKDMTKEERFDRDSISQVPQKKMRIMEARVAEEQKAKDEDPLRARKPGDKGWVGRARVPMPSGRDYLNRPDPTVEIDFSKAVAKGQMDRFQKQKKKYLEKKGRIADGKAMPISLSGGKMSL